MMVRLSLCLALISVLFVGCARPPRDEPANFDRLGAADIYVKKGIGYMDAGMLDVALTDLKHALELDAGNTGAHSAIAVLYERLGEIERARTHYQRAFDLQDSDPGIRNNLGRFLCNNGDAAGGMRYLEPILNDHLRPNPWLATTNVGICARVQGKLGDAERYLRLALQQNPKFPPALLELAKVSWDKREPMSARAFLQRYQEVGAMNADALWIGIQAESALGADETVHRYLDMLRAQFPDATETREANRRFGNN